MMISLNNKFIITTLLSLFLFSCNPAKQGNKSLRSLDSIQIGYQAVILISKDRGKSYEELTLPEQNVLWLYHSHDYSII